MRDWTTSNRVAHLARRLGTFDIALIVMGSVIGSGIFRTPSVVAQRAPEPALIIFAWVAGGIVALCGVFVLAELGARRPDDCGPYAYLRDAFHPIVGFAYGWSALLAVLSGGLAAAAVLFSGYFLSLTGLEVAPPLVAATTLGVLALLNALGVRQGATAQNLFTILKVAALAALILAGFAVHPITHQQISLPPMSFAGTIGAFAVALVPVLFAYSGPQVANFMAGETKESVRALPLGLVLGMIAVVIAYVLVNVVCVRVLGANALARTDVPAAAVFSAAVGPTGTRLASIAIALSTLGYMSNRMLTVPRMYQAMAADRLFFNSVALIHPRTKVPLIAVMLQAIVAIAIALTASYGHILNYTVSVIAAFNGLLALAIFSLRARDLNRDAISSRVFRVPWHPVTTLVFMLMSWGVAIATCVAYPFDGLMGLAIVLSSVPVYLLWVRRTAPQRTEI